MPESNRKQVQEELEDLQLQEAREAADLRRANRVQKQSRILAIEESLRRDRVNQATIQAACYHKKGGKGTAQLYQGNDPNYAVITHTLSHGVTIVICQRCGHKWEPPAKLAKNASPADRAKYREDLAEYRRALSFPTDNEPSGTTLFAFAEPDQDAA
jgi:hypothetical protein